MDTSENVWDTETAVAYDTPGEGMFSPNVLDPTVARLAELADGGAALEFAVGTGRVAVPLAERGVPVMGIEWPAELDLMARIAGFALESRHADWRGGEFTAEARSHVSTYRLSTNG